MVTEQDKSDVVQVLRTCRSRMLSYSSGYDSIPTHVDIRFDLHGTTAGKFRSPNLIRLNPTLFLNNKEEFLKRTVPHEFAHLVVRALYGNAPKSHGPEWKLVMARLGVPAIRCHTYDLSGIKRRKVKYFRLNCSCTTHEVSATVYNRIRRGLKYHCKKCKGGLV